jgi:hypothetical protein
MGCHLRVFRQGGAFIVGQLHLEGGTLMFGGAVGLGGHFSSCRCCLGAGIDGGGDGGCCLGVNTDSVGLGLGLLQENSMEECTPSISRAQRRALLLAISVIHAPSHSLLLSLALLHILPSYLPHNLLVGHLYVLRPLSAHLTSVSRRTHIHILPCVLRCTPLPFLPPFLFFFQFCVLLQIRLAIHLVLHLLIVVVLLHGCR